MNRDGGTSDESVLVAAAGAVEDEICELMACWRGQIVQSSKEYMIQMKRLRNQASFQLQVADCTAEEQKISRNLHSVEQKAENKTLTNFQYQIRSYLNWLLIGGCRSMPGRCEERFSRRCRGNRRWKLHRS